MTSHFSKKKYEKKREERSYIFLDVIKNRIDQILSSRATFNSPFPYLFLPLIRSLNVFKKFDVTCAQKRFQPARAFT